MRGKFPALVSCHGGDHVASSKIADRYKDYNTLRRSLSEYRRRDNKIKNCVAFQLETAAEWLNTWRIMIRHPLKPMK